MFVAGSSVRPQGWFLFQEQLAGLAESMVYILGAPGLPGQDEQVEGKGEHISLSHRCGLMQAGKEFLAPLYRFRK